MPIRRNRLRAAAPISYVTEILESRTLLNAADLDPTFGTGGLASTYLNGYGQSIGFAAAVQSDGKTVVAGDDYSTGVESAMTVSRYNTNGTLDATFGNGGEVEIGLGAYAAAHAIAIQSDGKIVVAGSSGSTIATGEFAVARLTASGALDTTFNSTGTEVVAFGGTFDSASSVAIQSDGKIVLGGGYTSAGPNDHFALARLNANGGLDSTYGAGGLVTTTITTTTPSDDAINGIAIDSNGDVVATGFVGYSNNSSFGVARYTTTGALDTTFGTNGVVVTSVGGADRPAGVAIQSDGKIVVAGTSGSSFAAARYTTAGVLDATFGNSGEFLYTTNTDLCTGLGLMTNGDIILIGNSEVNSTQGYYPTMVRVGPTGGYDVTYGNNGAAILSSNIMIYGGAVRGNGVVDAVGEAPAPANQDVVQFTTPGAADTTFGSTGVEATDFSVPVLTYPRASALQSDGKLVVAGTFYQGAGTTRARQGFVARYNTNGTLDTTFGTAGVVTIAPSKLCDLSAAVVQSNGDIVVEGSVQDAGSTSQYVIVERLLPTGAIDTTFATSGKRIFNAAAGYSSDETATALLLQSDGKLLAMNYGSEGGWITRLTTTGALDTTYGESATGLELTTQPFVAATLDSSGRLIVGGGTYLARYTTSGTLDTTFNASSSLSVYISSGAADTTIAAQPDGKILIAGSLSSAQIQRLNTNGSADTSFGLNSVVTANLSNNPFMSVTVLANGDILAAGQIVPGDYVVNAYDMSGAPITSFGTNGSQTIAVSSSNSNPVVAITARPNGKIIISGHSTSTIIAQLVGDLPAVIPGTAGNDSITLTQDTDHAHIDWITGSTSGQVLITDPAGLLINGNGGADTITLVGANGNAVPNALHLNGTFTLNGLSGVNTLLNGNLEIGNSVVYITYAGPASDPLATIQGYLKNGYNNGSWTGTPTPSTGVITSSAAALNPNNFAIGYADSADVGNPANIATANTIELRYAGIGDTNLNNTVDINDYNAVVRNFGVGAKWDQGDVTYDATVSINDYNAVVRHFGNVVTAQSPTPSEAIAATPLATTGTTPSAATAVTTDTSPSAVFPATTVSSTDEKSIKMKKLIKRSHK